MFTTLLPLYADRDWDGLIPGELIVGSDYLYVEFTEDSTRAPIQPFRVFIETFGCDVDNSSKCFEENAMILPDVCFMVRVDVRDSRKRWMTTCTSSCKLDAESFQASCVIPSQVNSCIGPYTASLDDVDFISSLIRWYDTSLTVAGNIDELSLYRAVVFDDNIYKRPNPVKMRRGDILTVRTFYR